MSRTLGPLRLARTLFAAGRAAEGAEEEDVAEGLAEGQADGEVARVLGDLLLADLAFFLEFLQRGHDHGQQLQDDRGGDVGHDPQREEREAREAAAREEVEEAEDVGAAEVVLQFLDRVDVDSGRGDVGAQPVEEQHRRREGEFLADVGDAEGVRDGPEHQRSRVWQEPPAASIFSLAAALKACACTSSFFEISPRARILTGSERFARPFSLSVLGVDLGAGVEAILEVGDVDRLGRGAEVLERHRGLFVRAAKLSHPHVDRVLPALVAGLLLRARARAVALVAAAGGLAAAALAAADPLARPFRARLRPDVVQPDLLRALARGLLVFGRFLSLFAVFSATVDLDEMRDDPDLPLQLRASPCARRPCRSGRARERPASLSGSGWSRSRTEPA